MCAGGYPVPCIITNMQPAALPTDEPAGSCAALPAESPSALLEDEPAGPCAALTAYLHVYF